MERVMKRVGLVLAALTIALLFVSCEFVVDYFNRFYVDDVEYPIDKMTVATRTDNGDGTWGLVIVLMSESIDFYPNPTEPPGIPLDGGPGQVLRLTVNSPASSLAEGDYVWTDSTNEYTFSFGTAAINANYDRGAIGDSDSFFRGDYAQSSGSVSVAETILGDLVIDFELNFAYDSGNNEYANISGHFRGSYEIADYPDPI